MFEFLKQNKDGTFQDLIEIASVNMEKIQTARMAVEKAKNMIAKAIAKSEIVLLDKKHDRRFDEQYYRLNVRPNDNQTGTDFWYQAVYTMLSDGEALIVRLNDKYYLANNGCQKSNEVLFGKTYRNVTITDGSDEYTLGKIFYEDDVIHLKYDNPKLRIFANNVVNIYTDTISALQRASAIAAGPFFKFKTDGNITFRRQNVDGTEQRLTIDDVIDTLKKQIEDGGISILKEQSGTEIEALKIETGTTISDLKSMTDEIYRTVEKIFDIPHGVFYGEITEQSDATNEFITYAVDPIAEVISDSLNAKLVGSDDYISGERAFVWLAKFKHRDTLDNADKIDKLRADGYTLDECRELSGMWTLNTEFSTSRVITKNYSVEAGKDAGAETASDDGDEPNKINQQATGKLSKHKERRLKRNG